MGKASSRCPGTLGGFHRLRVLLENWLTSETGQPFQMWQAKRGTAFGIPSTESHGLWLQFTQQDYECFFYSGDPRTQEEYGLGENWREGGEGESWHLCSEVIQNPAQRRWKPAYLIVLANCEFTGEAIILQRGWELVPLLNKE